MISTDEMMGYSRRRGTLNYRFQQAVKRRLRALDMTQRDLAERLGVTDARVSMLLNEDNATIASWERVFETLGITVRFEIEEEE